jgi:hypothetical protein
MVILSSDLLFVDLPQNLDMKTKFYMFETKNIY